jgi:hypothetical protein
LRFFNRSGGSCGLAGYPVVSGRTPSGAWVEVPTMPLDLAPTNGPPWTGVFSVELTAVVSLRAEPNSQCGPNPRRAGYEALRLTLPGGAGDIDIDLAFTFDGCPLQITPFSADSQDS